MSGGDGIEAYHRGRREYEEDRQDLVIEPRGKDPATHWQNHVLRKIAKMKPEDWKPREKDLPLLATPADLRTKWPIAFRGPGKVEMETYAFETKPNSKAKFVGVAVPGGGRPDAYLLYFRHTARDSDYRGGQGLLEVGIGDYLVGRMQLVQQISASGKRVAVVVPIAIGGSGEFEHDEKFVRTALKDIDHELYGGDQMLPPLLLASNSDGIEKLNRFIDNCHSLAVTAKAIYDFDGLWIHNRPALHRAGKAARVIRYVGEHAAVPRRDESVIAFLGRAMGANPAEVPLPYDRWSGGNGVPPHPHFNPSLEPSDRVIDRGNWLHHRIPGCMLTHALLETPGL